MTAAKIASKTQPLSGESAGNLLTLKFTVKPGKEAADAAKSKTELRNFLKKMF